MQVFILGLVVLISIPSISAKEATVPARGGVLRGAGRVLYGDNMMDSHGNGDHQDGMMNSDETNSAYGDHMSQHNNGMMYSEETNSTYGDNMTSWHHNSDDSMHGGNHNYHSGGFVAPSSRQCNTQLTSDQVQCACRSNMTGMMSGFEDELKFKIRATKGDFLTIIVEYQPEGESTQSDGNSTATQFSLVYDRLLEYRKVGNATDNHYEWGVDEVVAEIPLNDWDELSAVPSTDNLIIYSAISSMVTFTFTIAQIDLNDLSTNKMKIDFSLENYPWNASGNTYVALVNRIETHRKIEAHMEKGMDDVSDIMINFEDAVHTIGFVPFGQYTWATTAEATTGGNPMDSLNGTDIMIERGASVGENETTTIPVIASMLSTTTGTTGDANSSEEIAFSFVGVGQGANRIYWDPEAGIGYTSTSSSSKCNSPSSLLATIVSLGLAWCM